MSRTSARSLLLSMSSGLAFSVLPRMASALDSEPNDTCGTAEPTPRVFSGEGGLSSTDAQDSFETTSTVPGPLNFTLVNLSNTTDDFALELFDSSSSSVASASSSGGVAELSYTVSTAGDTYCLAVTGSEGDYWLSGDLIADPPTISDVQDSSGNPITSASIGDTITILGTLLGTSASDVEVTFGGVYGTISAITPTEIDVVVPENAVNGDLYVLRGDARSNAYSFSVGVSSLASSSSTAADPSWLNAGPGPRVFLNRTLVTFVGGADSTAVSNTLDAVLALDSNRESWSLVGFSPRRNAYQVEWSWIDTYTPLWSDTESLLDDLDAESSVEGVDPEYLIRMYSLDVPTDFDLLHDAGAERGAFAQVGLEEARRLFRYSALGSMSSEPSVVLVDSGLRYGTSTWDSGTECLSHTVGSGGTVDEFPSSHFSLVELNSGLWSTSAAPGHFAYMPGSTVHGNTMAGIVGARSQGEPDWDDGAARSGLNANGVLGAFELQGVDDDGDSYIDLDDVGESIPYDVVVFNGFSQGGSPTRETNWLLFDAFETLANDPTYDGSVLVIATGWTGQWPMKFWFRHNKVIKDICRSRIIVAAAGNGGDEIGVGSWPWSDNALASSLAAVCPERSIIVGGTEAGGNGNGTDTRMTHAVAGDANYGEAVDLLAPASAFTMATVCQGSGVHPGYAEGVPGTSPAAALVGAMVALVRGIVDPSTLSNAAVVNLVETSVDDVSSLYTDDGAQSRLDLYEAVERALGYAGGLPEHMLGTVRIFAVDYSNDVLVAQDIEDLSDGTFASSSTVITAAVSANGCYGPSDVEVHPSGDVVYVLCADTDMIASYTADDLDFIGSVEFDGSVTSYGELEITPDGIIRVPTIDGSGELTLESYDSYSGLKHLDPETLYSSSTLATAYAIHASHDATELAVVATDGTSASDDYDVLSLVAPSPVDKAASTVTNDDLSSTTGTYLARDVAWRSDDSSALAVLYGNGSGGDVETYESDWASVSNDATIDYCEDVVSIAMNPTGEDSYAYVSCQSNHHLAVVDLASTASGYTPDFFLYGGISSSVAGNYTPTIVEFAPNGRFVYGGFQYTGGGSSWSWVVTAGHDMVLSYASSDLYLGSYDIMGYAGFDTPRGLDITPLLSVMSPRPGIEVSGVRTLQVVVRDPDVVEVDFYEGTTSLCSDSAVLDGIAECEIDWSTWTAGDYVIEIEATTSAADQYRIQVPYRVP